MYCPKCGTKLPDVARFCTKCGRALANPPKPKPGEPGKSHSQAELLPLTPRVIKPTESNVQLDQSSEEEKERVPSFTEQTRAQVPSIAPDLLALWRQVGFSLTGLGTLVVLIAFFLGWFHVSSPLANVMFGGLAAFDISGMTILTGFPELGLPGSPAVTVVLLLALLPLAVSISRVKQTKLGNYSRVIGIGGGVLGIAYMLAMLLGTQALYESAFQRLGLPPMVGQKIISLEPAIGFWLTLLGFILVIGGGIWNWQNR